MSAIGGFILALALVAVALECSMDGPTSWRMPTVNQRSWVLIICDCIVILLAITAIAHGAELHWQQRDGEAPIQAWRVKRLMSPTPVATILRTAAVEETVTPPATPWFPTAGPGTPTPIVRQYSADLPIQEGWTVVLQTEDDRGLLSADSNAKVIPTWTPTPAATFTASNTRTQTQTRTATKKPPEGPHVMP